MRESYIFIPVILGGLFLILCMVIVLVLHQQKMTKLLHPIGNKSLDNPDEVASMRSELAAMRELIMHQSLAIESLGDKISGIDYGIPARVQDRLKEEA